jgi:hypothetical protein
LKEFVFAVAVALPYHVADAAYAAGLALMGASRFTVPRPFLRELAYFLLGHAHFRCLANLDASQI